MSKPDPENPPYLTIAKLFGQFNVNKMEWESRDGDGAYQVTHNKPFQTMGQAEQFRDEWAKADGLEVR